MSQFKTINRPSWTLQKARKFNKLWLDKNENTHPKLVKLYQNILRNIKPIHISTYPELGSLYKKISKYEKVSTENIIFGHGSDGCIKNIFEAFTQKSQKILSLSPTFAMYDVYPKIFNLKHSKFDYSFSKKGPKLDLNELLKKIRSEKPKLLCIANPNSPTGTVLEITDLIKLTKACYKVKCNFLIDEAYYGFYEKTSKILIKKHNNVFIIRSLSKAWGLAGLRLGYIISNKKNIKILNKIRPMYEINTFGTEFLKLLLNRKYLNQLNLIIKDMKNAKNIFCKFLKKKKIEYFPSDGNFVHFKIKNPDMSRIKLPEERAINITNTKRIGFNEKN